MKFAYPATFFRNTNCNSRGIHQQVGEKPDSVKGFIMYDNEMIEFEDEMFNHYLHHFDECDTEHIAFNEEFDCIEVAANLIEEIIWN